MVQLTLAHISKHLTKEVIDLAFKRKARGEGTANTIEITRAAPAGEGLLSAVYRIHVTGNNHESTFIVKGLVSDQLLRKSLDCPKYFTREAYFFSKILPTLIELQKSTGAKERVQSCIPICYSYHVDGENDYIMIEDLSESQCISLCENPTKNERYMCLKVLAHMHAVSLALRIIKPDEFKKIAYEIPELYYNQTNRNFYIRYLEDAIEVDRTALAEYEDSSSIYYKKFNELVDNDVYGQLVRLVTEWGDHPVLNHGDAWCPNFLSSKQKAVAIDFQLVRCASPATDVSYFILCSNLCKDKNDFTNSVQIYYEYLEYYLKDIGLEASDVFSWETLQEELRKYGRYGLLASLTTIPLLAGERCDNLTSFEEKFSGLEKIPLEILWELAPIENEFYKMRLVDAVRVAVDVGLI